MYLGGFGKEVALHVEEGLLVAVHHPAAAAIEHLLNRIPVVHYVDVLFALHLCR